jgi:hypothetical protein
VDALIGPYQVVSTWGEQLDLGSTTALLAAYGMHGLLLAVELLGKLSRWVGVEGGGSMHCRQRSCMNTLSTCVLHRLPAVTRTLAHTRYTYAADLSRRLSCALLAAELVPAVFAGHIIHPPRRVDFAAYVPVELCPGADVFDDPHRCDACVCACVLGPRVT